MYLLAASFIGFVVLTWIVNRINATHEAKKVEQSESGDARVTTAWDDFGLGEDPAVWRAALEELLGRLDLDELAQKQSLVRLAIMAVRSDHMDPLPQIAARATRIDPGCSETRALEALAEAYAGPAERAIPKLRDATAGLASCSGCGAGVEGGILKQEVALALDALASGEVLNRMAPLRDATASG